MKRYYGLILKEELKEQEMGVHTHWESGNY